MKQLEEKKKAFYKETDELLGGTFKCHVRDAIWEWIEQALEEVEIEERNIGAELCAKQLLKELENPTTGRFSSETMNKIIDFHRTALEEVEKKAKAEIFNYLENEMDICDRDECVQNNCGRCRDYYLFKDKQLKGE